MNLILLSPNFVLCILDEIKWNKVNSDAENGVDLDVLFIKIKLYQTFGEPVLQSDLVLEIQFAYPSLKI